MNTYQLQCYQIGSDEREGPQQKKVKAGSQVGECYDSLGKWGWQLN